MEILDILKDLIGLVGVGIIVWGVLLTLLRLIRLEFRRLKHKVIYHQREALRHAFGSYLLLALEFIIAADIIASITHPTLQEVAFLGGIVAIRTVISYFLEKEIARYSPPETKEV